MSTESEILKVEELVQRESSYQCWRIAGGFDSSMERCPGGNLNMCLQLPKGTGCPERHLLII